MLANDRASAGFAAAGEAAARAGGDVKGLADRLDDISHKSATARVGLDGDKDAQDQLDKLDVKLLLVGKRRANPNITLEGALKANLQIAGIEAELDALNKKSADIRLGVTAGALPAPGGAGASGGTSAGSGLAGISPAVIGGAIGAAALAAPFIAQVISAGIVAGFGSGLAAIAIVGAAKTKEIQGDFAGLKTQANKSLTEIGTPFVPVLNSIAKTASTVLGEMTKPFEGAAATISGPFRQFGDTLLKSFGSPAVKTSIQAVATAFGAILKAVTPQLGADIDKVAVQITNIATTITKNPRAFADFVGFLFDIAEISLQAVAGLTKTATWIEKHWDLLGPVLVGPFTAMTKPIEHAFSDTLGFITHVWGAIKQQGKIFWDGLNDEVNHGMSEEGTAIRHGWDDTIRFLEGLPGQAVHALSAMGGGLERTAKSAMGDLLSGFESPVKGILNFLDGIAGKIVGVFKGVLKISSPSAVFFDIGKSLMDGLALGVKAHAHTALGAIEGVAGAVPGVSGSAVSWLMAAIKDTGAPASWLPGLEKIMSKESGGNPQAVNPATAGASGEHAEGLMQTIPSTFAAYATVPGGIFNPVANAVASIRYIMSQYGSPYNIPGIGNNAPYQGYAAGTGWAMPGLAVVGERGPEALMLRGGERITPMSPASAAGGGGNTYNIHVSPTPLARPADIGREVVTAIVQFEKRSGSGWRN